jgi:ABC-type nitrate/sulfonate/bicarbonate transport system substrate-binding protein
MTMVASLVLSLSGCKKKPTVKGQTLKIAFSSAPDGIDVVGYKVAEILKAEGINVEYMYADGGPKAVQALLAGQAEVVATSLEDIVNAGLYGFALNRPKNLYTLVGSKSIKTLEDLKGKNLGAADPGSIANIIADAIFTKHNIPLDAVKRIQIGGNSARSSALLAGKVDAVWVYGGNYLKLRREGFTTLTTLVADYPGVHDDMWAAKKEWLDAHPDLAVAICKAQIAAAKWFKDKPDEWLALAKSKVEALDEVDAKELYNVLKENDMYPVDGLLTMETIKTTADFLIKAQSIPDKPVETWATDKYMNQARKELGITK